MFTKKEMLKEASKPTATLEEVHEEFDSASERILRQAEEILAKQTEEDLKDIKVLASLGFREPSKVLTEYELSKEESEAANYYKKYPYKFITDNELQRICKKYGLVIGRPQDFIGEIPTKNRKDIVNLNVDEKDKTYVRRTSGWGRFYYDRVIFDMKVEATGSDFRYSYTEDIKIAATLDQFDMEDKIVKDYEIKLIDKDPIVLQGVKGGWLIITKWGNESNL